MIDFESFKKLYNSIPGEPEFEVCFNNTTDTYMIIKYPNEVSFQKCCDKQHSGEIICCSLDELYNSILYDNICLKRDWNDISDIIVDGAWSVLDDKDEIKRIFNITLRARGKI